MKPSSERFRTASNRGIQLHSIHWGRPSRPPLVLLHGGGANAHWWDHVAPAFADDFHVVALDFRGHGDSEHPDFAEVGAFQWDLEALLQHLGGEAVLIGHSMGAAVALEHAAHRGGVRALVAIDLARGSGPRTRRAARLALAARQSYDTRERAIERFQFLPPAPRASEELRRHVAEHSVTALADGRFSFKFDPRWFGLPPRPRPPLEQVKCPVLLLRGSESTLLSTEGAAKLVAELPDAFLVEIEGAGHNVHIERGSEVISAVREFLRARL